MTWIISETDVEVIRNARRALKEIGVRARRDTTDPRGATAVMIMAEQTEHALFRFLNLSSAHGHQAIAARDIHRTAPRPEPDA